MKTTTAYIPVPVEERKPLINKYTSDWYFVTNRDDEREVGMALSDGGLKTWDTDFNPTHWLEKKEDVFVLTKEELEKVFHEAWYLGAKSAFERESSEERYADTDFNDWLNTQK